jgi:hypothetical protein
MLPVFCAVSSMKVVLLLNGIGLFCFCALDTAFVYASFGKGRGDHKKGVKMKLSGFRAFLYWLAKILGDISAVQKGKVGRRVARRAAGKLTGRGLGKLFK